VGFKPILGLDLGMCTLGIAISRSGHMASPLENMHFPNGKFDDCYPRVIQYIRDNFIGLVVLGRPCFPSGDPSPMTETVLGFKAELEKRLSEANIKIDIVLQDEQYSTLEAASLMHDENLSHRKQKPKIDQVAACVILERYLRKNGYDVW